MKKFHCTVILLVLFLSTLLALPTLARADVFFNGYVWVSNICRTGSYYTVMPFYMPIGNQCVNSYWGVTGVVTNN